MSDINLEKMYTSSDYKKLYHLEKLGQTEHWDVKGFIELLQNNINLGERASNSLLFHNKEFFKYIKMVLINKQTKFSVPENLTKEMARFSDKISKLTNENDSFKGLEIYRKSDIKDLACFNTFTGMLFLKLCQPDVEFGGFFEDMNSDTLRSNWRAKEYYWLGNFSSIQGFNDEEKNMRCMKNLKKEFYEIAEIEGICPFEMQNTFLQKVLFGQETNFFGNMHINNRVKRIFLFDIIFDEYLLKELPVLKETKRHVYDGLLESAVYYICQMDKEYNTHYLSNIRTVYSSPQYEQMKNSRKFFEEMLDKMPRDILSVEIIDSWEIKSIIRLIPELEKFKREQDLRDNFNEIDKLRESEKLVAAKKKI